MMPGKERTAIMRELKAAGERYEVHRAGGTLFRYYAWPSVCRDERGTLYAVSSGFRVKHVDPTGKNCIYVSFNGGKSWTPPVVVNDSYLDDRDTGILYLGGGKMLISWFSSRYDDDCRRIQKVDWATPAEKALLYGYSDTLQYLPPDELRPGSYIKLSDDYGVTWSDRIRVPVTAPHGPVRLKDGSLLYIGKTWGDGWQCGGDNPVSAYKSADGGKTWEYLSDIPLPDGVENNRAWEPHGAELPGGRIIAGIRVHDMVPDFTVYTSFSDDGGHSWSVARPTGLDGSPPHFLVHSSGALLLTYARRRAAGNRGERCAVSYDGGETWATDYIIDPEADSGHAGDLGYPASAELDDGSVLTVYYQILPGDGAPSILAKKWRLENRPEIQ